MTATIEKTFSNVHLSGQYVPTEIDHAKAAADIRITSIEGAKYAIRSKVELTGNGIKELATGTYLVTKKALATLSSRYDVVTDF